MICMLDLMICMLDPHDFHGRSLGLRARSYDLPVRSHDLRFRPHDLRARPFFDRFKDPGIMIYKFQTAVEHDRAVRGPGPGVQVGRDQAEGEAEDCEPPSHSGPQDEVGRGKDVRG